MIQSNIYSHLRLTCIDGVVQDSMVLLVFIHVSWHATMIRCQVAFSGSSGGSLIAHLGFQPFGWSCGTIMEWTVRGAYPSGHLTIRRGKHPIHSWFASQNGDCPVRNVLTLPHGNHSTSRWGVSWHVARRFVTSLISSWNSHLAHPVHRQWQNEPMESAYSVLWMFGI